MIAPIVLIIALFSSLFLLPVQNAPILLLVYIVPCVSNVPMLVLV